jgi:hypothetical protein
MPNILLSKKVGYSLFSLPAAAQPASIPALFKMASADK